MQTQYRVLTPLYPISFITDILHCMMCVCVCVCEYVYLTTKSCPNLCNSMDCSPSGSSVHGISQARILEWVVIPISRGSSPPMYPAIQADFLTTEPLGKPKILHWHGAFVKINDLTLMYYY